MKFIELKDFLRKENAENFHVHKGENLEVEGLTGLDVPRGSHLFFLGEKKYLEQLKEAVKKESWESGPYFALLSDKLWGDIGDEERELVDNSFSGVATVSDVPLAMCSLSRPFFEKREQERNDLVDGRQMGTASVHPTAWVGQSVFLGANVEIAANARIHPGCVIMSGSRVGEGCVLYPNVTMYPDVTLGENCRIHGGVTLGSDGFGYHFHQGVHEKIWHLGGLIIESEVEIGANSCVDGGTFAPTYIARGCKLDNHVQVGHNCHLGEAVILCGQVAIGGSAKIGAYTVFGGKAGAGHDIELAPQTEVAGGALVNTSWKEKLQLGGHPARPLKEWLKGLAFIRKESLKKSRE